ncbi:hypothetical protein OE88DRAFT_372433 [Heliocybe sulcata]|uniref:SHSP domain-containing protein n=1 Tax=Heliocybe sulcata TaxID=5364 RepID=A0A5C3MXU8_9AGAM|nr:hypothetical protein OE88DRAFT_372433 [Heliocybe sulcata]
MGHPDTTTRPRSPIVTTLSPPTSAPCSRSPSPEPQQPESPTARSRRSPPPSKSPPVVVKSTTSRYTLTVDLGPKFQSEMVTIAAKKGDSVDVVADLWYLENDCHHEWRIQFPPADVDLTSARATIQEGQLCIYVKRRRKY